MNIQDEERVLIEIYKSTEAALSEAKVRLQEAKARDAVAQTRYDDAKQAIIDYAMGNNIVETENYKISTIKSKSVDVTDIDSVPEEYIRIKKEVNKAAIKALKLPESNWLKYTENETIKLEVR